MSLLFVALVATALAEDLQHQLVWDLTVSGQRVGERQMTVKYTEADDGTTRRILEGYTDIHGALGPIQVRYRQRMTASAEGRAPASFHSVIDENGRLMEIQGRWTPSTWVVTTIADNRSRTTEHPLNRIDLSTADLIDPYSRHTLAHATNASVLSAETGQVSSGKVERLGVSELRIDGQPIQVTGYAWDSSQGRSAFYYSPDGFLVRYETQLLGVPMEAQLRSPPPGGVDDFPVAVGRPAIEQIDL